MAAFAELMRAFLKFDLQDQLSAIRAPAMVLVGELDILKTPRYARAIAGGIPGAEFVIVPGAGHALSWEQPGAFNSVVLGFTLKHAVRFGNLV
jgi:pimeloyl-ACP methyl ester carboxylesterase